MRVGLARPQMPAWPAATPPREPPAGRPSLGRVDCNAKRRRLAEDY
jgi:hypothetical protein